MLVADTRETRFLTDEEDQRHRASYAETVRPDVPPQLYSDNVRQCCLLGAQLYLNPVAVLHWCHYWLAQYSNYALPEQDWLADLVQGLLYEQPQLRLLASETPPLDNAGHLLTRAPQLLCFAGTDRHAIPLEQVLRATQLQVMYPLSHLLLSQHHCFRSRTSDALDGELELGSFVYDSLVLAELYEPSFMIVTLYRMHLCELLHNTGAHCCQDVLPRHMHSLRAIAHETVDWTRVERTHGHAVTLLQQELAVLHQTLHQTDLHQALAQVSALWTEKAADCDSRLVEAPLRLWRRLQ